MLTAIELCVNPGFYGLHPLFTLLLSNNSSIFNDTDTTLAISVTHNAIDTNKTKDKSVQREALYICSTCSCCGFLCGIAMSPVYLGKFQCYYKNSGSCLKYRLLFNYLLPIT